MIVNAAYNFSTRLASAQTSNRAAVAPAPAVLPRQKSLRQIALDQDRNITSFYFFQKREFLVRNK